MSGADFTLRGTSGPCSGRRYAARAGCLTLGRVGGNDVVIRDPGISRRHLRIRTAGSAWIVEDMGSSNGTFIEGRRLQRPVVLRGGEAIRVGQSELVFEASRRAEPWPRPPRTPSRRRPLIVAAVGVVALVALSAALLARRATAQAAGTLDMDALPASASFGVGPEVTNPAPVEARFSFRGREDTVFTLHYRAAEVAWEGLVELRLNGTALGHVAPAGAELEDRSIDLPRSAIRPGENELAFVVSRNERMPHVGWRVAGLRLVREPLPACGASCVDEARELQAIGRGYLESAAVDPANVQRAHAALSRARLLLAAVPEPTPLQEENRTLLRRAGEEVDRLCARLRFTATRHFALGDAAAAEAAARSILEAFPDGDHACHGAALHMLDVLGVVP
jgi:hypothetical protein